LFSEYFKNYDHLLYLHTAQTHIHEILFNQSVISLEYGVLLGKPKGKRELQKPRRKSVDNIDADLKLVGWKEVEWIHLANNRDGWRAIVNSTVKIRAS
jgi:hypothetical protein